MTAARAAFGAVAAAVLVAIGCTPAPLDPNGNPNGNPTTGGTTGQGGAPESTLVATLRALAAEPGRQVIIGTNGGMVVAAASDAIALFAGTDPEALMEAAAVVGLPVCSVEPQSLTFTSVTSNATGLSTLDATAFCASDNLTEMIDRLNGLKTPELVVVIAANTAITVHSTNGGINAYYDDDIGRTLRAARRLYIPACIVAPDALALPTPPSGQTPGLSTAEALARCGRS